MIKSNIQTTLFFFSPDMGWSCFFFSNIYFSIRNAYTHEEETFWERYPFEDTLEKADDLCEIGYTFQKNELIFKKISKTVGLQRFAEY